MQNMNERGLDIVQTPQVFLFTNRHLKDQFPAYFCQEKSVYFCSINNCLHVLHVQLGKECIKYEKQPAQVLYQKLKKRLFIASYKYLHSSAETFRIFDNEYILDHTCLQRSKQSRRVPKFRKTIRKQHTLGRR